MTITVSQARAEADSCGMDISSENIINGKSYFIVFDTTNNDSVIVDRVGCVHWRPEGTSGSYLRGSSIMIAVVTLLSRRNK